MNEYCPWEELGLTEVEYWKQRYIEAQKSLVDYETDWLKMRKYYDGAMEKMAIAIEALKDIEFYGQGYAKLKATGTIDKLK